jgi:hypothetical protein
MHVAVSAWWSKYVQCACSHTGTSHTRGTSEEGDDTKLTENAFHPNVSANTLSPRTRKTATSLRAQPFTRIIREVGGHIE